MSTKFGSRWLVVSLFCIFVLLLLPSTSANAVFNYTDNNVDNDSDIDSNVNIGNDGTTSYTDAQAIGGSDQVIAEENTIENVPWLNFKTITIDATKIDEDLINFPVLISLYDPDLRTKTTSTGDNIAFFDVNENQLEHTFEAFDQYYNASHTQMIAWVKVNLSSAVDTTIFMKYGSSQSITQNPENVWDSNYAGVWHLNEDPSGTLYDSTSNSNDGTSTGSPNSIAGNILNAVEFTAPGSDQYVEILDSASLDLANTFTIESWIYPDILGGWQTVMSKMNGAYGNADPTNEDFYFAVSSSGQFLI
ncbi:MAG: hypothetical protein ACXAD7_27030, partial [Candidatus Kariarchaeaceae archaeon]